MSSYKSKLATLRGTLLALGLVAASGAAMADSAVTLTASSTNAVLPDGQSVPMWGYTCGTPAAGTNTSGATCAALNPNAAGGWSPVIIRVPFGAPLTITLANSLLVPTSIVIDGQLGGGLGNAPTRMASPAHPAQGTTWPGTAGDATPSSCNSGGGGGGDTGTFCPPGQADRVHSFGTEVAAGNAGTALTWSNLRPGTYLIHSGTEPSIQHPMGLYGVLVVTETTANSAYGTTFDGDVPLLFSEIDPEQNAAVAAAVAATGFSETATWAGPGQCKDPTTGVVTAGVACYPPAVNYSPRYYLINGTSFDRTKVAASTFAGPATGASGNVLLRIVNAGQRLHVPALVGADLTLLAEDGNGNKVPGTARVQASIPMPPGKTFDAVINPAFSGTAYAAATLPVYDRQLSLSTNNQRGGGMLAYITLAGGALTGVGSADSGVGLSANLTPAYFCVAGTTLTVSSASKGVLAGSVGASGVSIDPTVIANYGGNVNATNLVLNADGTFTYTQAPGASACGGTFTYLVNGTLSATATISQCDATSSSAAGCSLATAPTANPFVVISSVASRYASPPPGVLAYVTNPGGLSLSAGGGVNADGSFAVAGPGTTGGCAGAPAGVPVGATCVQVPYTVKDAQGQTASATGYVAFQAGSGLALTVKDGPSGNSIANDYRWIIEEDRTFWVDPKCQVNQVVDATHPRAVDSYGRTCPPLPVESLGYNFHTAHMPVIAAGCVGTVSCEAGQKLQGADTVCDVGNGVCRAGTSKTPTSPADVHLDPNKHYYISILPGDAINPTVSGFGGTAADCGKFDTVPDNSPTDPHPTTANWVLYNPADGSSGNCGHEMGGAQIAPGQLAVTINLQQIPLPTAKISVFVFEDDNPLNGENDAGGGVDVIAPNEPGLGGFEVKLFDQAGQLGDNTGQITYDEFNEPVTNSLAGYIDPITGLDACPIAARVTSSVQNDDGTQAGIVGMIPTCPKYESDGITPSPMAGQVVINNLYPGLYEVQAYPAADRIARGEEWLQTNTLDGGKPHEAFIIPNEPGYFQEFGPGGYHVAIGYANPAIIKARKAGYCNSALNTGTCTNTLNVEITNNHMSRTPDQRTYNSESYDHYSFTQCYVSIGPADAEDFDLQPCVMTTDAAGKTHAVASFTDMPPGTFKMSVFDQWNDIMLDGLVGTVEVGTGTTNKVFPVTQWRTNLYTRTYIDTDGNGVSAEDEPGLSLVNTNIRYRDGSIAFFNNTDLNGYAGFNEVFPFMNWLVVDTSQTRFKPTWTHVIYDAGGPVDGSVQSGPPLVHTPGWSASSSAAAYANTDVRVKLPPDLRVPGAKYCDNADCPLSDAGSGASSGMLFPRQLFSNSIGWQGLLGQDTFMEFGVKPFKKADPVAQTPAENGGIHGQVVYASTRPFDDPTLLLQLSWEPGVPHATVNLYSKTVDAQGNEVLKLVDTTESASWDDWAQGFRKDANGNLIVRTDGTYIPNMNCPGQDSTSPFFATLKNSKQWLDTADSSGNKKALAYNSQFKCYDGWSQLNQAQPAPYDGFYSFPSVTAVQPGFLPDGVTPNPNAGKPSKTNCAACTTNPDDGTPMLPAGTYVVEVITPAGYALVKEEDKNILMGDVYVAPVTQQFAGFGNIYIMPDQASVSSAYNAANPASLNTTYSLGAQPRHEGDTGSVESFWPCVGTLRQVPDFNSEFPGSSQAAPFAGAMRRLCDRKEVQLTDEASTLAKFYLYSDTHVAGHFAGTITNDFASEFDPFSPQFGEKFGPPNLPVGLRDFNGNEVGRVYSDQWGIYNGLFYSTWSPNPPNPTGYAPQMSIACMNDPGPIMVNGVSQTDPSYNPAYSNFCYEQPFMPGETSYLDTPVIPTQSFADGYNLPDTEYPDQTPAIRSVVNSSSSMPQGPWVRAATTAARASASFTISGVARCSNTTCTGFGQARTTITFPSGTVACTSTGAGGPNCSSASGTTRANNVAAYIRSNIVALMGAGYSATGTNASVTVNAPAVGASYNGTVVISATTNLGGPTAPVVLAGGADTAAASLGLTIAALGDKVVQNPHYTGPNASAAPFNQKTITRHYGFGASGTAGNSVVLVAPDGTTTAALTNVTWSDMSISGTVPTLPSAFNCRVQQRNAPVAQCGQLVINRGDNGKRSIDAITVTVGGSAPWVVTPTDVIAPSGKRVHDYGNGSDPDGNFGRMKLVLGAAHQSPIQVAIDSAAPGDLILVTPGTYRENLIMWKPVRLQGVGAGAVTVNADAHPAGHMDQWRRQMVCVFGLTLNGIPNIPLSQSKFDPSGAYTCPEPMFLTGDRIPFEAITGWQASGNGNLAQVLQEPTLLGAYEGAGITAVGRGVHVPNGDPYFLGNDPVAAGAFPDGSVYLTSGNSDCAVQSGTTARNGGNYGAGNYRCNPSRIDGLAILNSSQGGGGVFIHGWQHNLELSNNRISANHGTLAGAVNLGNGETPPVFVNDGTTCGAGVATLCPPIPNGTPTGGTIPFGFNTNVRVHHNMLWNNASIGDALFTGTPAGAGGVTVSSGGDDYSIDHNWIAGNLTTGDGGGIQQLGVNFRGRVANNVIMFNQSTNPTLPTNGGGMVVQGANEPRTLAGTECGGATDADCPPGLGDGTGEGLVIDSNLVYGNSAESGTGGGLALEMVNGSEVIAFPTTPNNWYGVTLSNNIIANNVAGYDGGGVSLRDTLKATLVNNTIISNDTTASAGVLFKTLGAVNASSPPPGCNAQTDPTLPQDPSCLGNDAPHGPQPSGLVTMAHTQNLNDSIAGIVPGNNGTRLRCPTGFGYANGSGNANGGMNNADCMKLSRPRLFNDLFWQNRTFSVDLAGAGGGLQSQQNLVALTPQLTQTITGQCPTGAQYWDIGLRTDDVQAGFISAAANKLAITNSVLTGSGDIGTAQETIADATNRLPADRPGASPVVRAQICNGARTPPEACTQLANGLGQNCQNFNLPPGASESTSTSQLFVFSGIQPTATVDEGHNWLNLTYGPLTLARSASLTTPTAGEQMVAGPATGTASGAYSIPVSSGAVGVGTTSGAPAVDFYGNSRSGRNDAGAVQVSIGTAGQRAIVFPGSVGFGQLRYSTTGTAQTLTLTNFGAAINGVTITVAGTGFSRVAGGNCPTTATFTLALNASCTFNVNVTIPTSTATTSTAYAGTVTIGNTSGVTFTNSPVALSATGVPASNDLFIAKTDGRSTLYRADRTTYTVTVTNGGNTTITGAIVNDTRPAALSSWSWSCAAVNGGSCGANPTSGTGNIAKTLGALPPGSGVVFTVNAVVSNTASGSAANTATVAMPAGVTDATPGNNSSTDTDVIAVGNGTAAFTSATLGTLAGNTLAFGSRAGTVSSTVTVTVTGSAVTFGNAILNAGNGSRFSIGADGCSTNTFTAGNTCTIVVNFNAQGNTARTGSITLIDNASNSPQVLNLTGQ